MRKRYATVTRLAILAASAATPLVTTITCDPRFGTVDFFRDDDHGRLDTWDLFIVDDCPFDCFFDVVF